MAIVKFEIDTLTTPMDAVAEVLRILSGGSVAAPKKESKKAAESESPKSEKIDDNVGKVEPPKAETTEKSVTIEEVRAAVAAKRTTHRQEIKDVLTKYGAESVTALDPANYAAVRNEINAL